MPKLAYSERAARAAWSKTSDLDLMAGIASDDDLAFDELIARKTQPLMQLAFRVLGEAEEARDVVQVTFLRVWQKRREFDPRWQPNTWIYRIATNLAIDHLRSRQSRDRSSEAVRYHIRQAGDGLANRAVGDLSRAEVHGIFLDLAQHLTEKQRMVFVLREVEERSSKEVAEILHCRESTVRNHLFNARKILRRELVRNYPEYAPRQRARGGKGGS